MPELAEVETIVSDLIKAKICNRKIAKVNIYKPSLIKPLIKEDFIKKVTNQKILKISRKGKNLIFQLDVFFLIIHLKMTGHIFLKDKNYKLQKHDHIEFFLSNDQKLVYYDTRCFGKIYLTKDLDGFFKKLGPDPMLDNLSSKFFLKKLKNKSKKIKTLLLDQNFICGIGNIYADEILFSSKMHPATISNKIPLKQANILLLSIKSVLKKGIKNRGTSLGTSRSNFSSILEDFGSNQNHLLVHTKKICPKCNGQITKIKINQRTTHFCSFCQK